MRQYFRQDGICFCSLGGQLPEGAKAVTEPFSPLVFLVHRDPRTSRGIFAVHDPSEVLEP